MDFGPTSVCTVAVVALRLSKGRELSSTTVDDLRCVWEEISVTAVSSVSSQDPPRRGGSVWRLLGGSLFTATLPDSTLEVALRTLVLERDLGTGSLFFLGVSSVLALP